MNPPLSNMKKEIKKRQSISPKPNWLGWIKWRPLHRDYSITCCDCGLAHRFQIRVVNGKVQWRAKKDKEATKLARI